MTEIELQTLRWINKVRSYLGLSALDKIQKGIRRNVHSCPVSNSICHGAEKRYSVVVGHDRLIIFDNTRPDNPFSEPYTNPHVKRFIRDFDDFNDPKYRKYLACGRGGQL